MTMITTSAPKMSMRQRSNCRSQSLTKMMMKAPIAGPGNLPTPPSSTMITR